MDLVEIEWIHLSLDRGQWWDLIFGFRKMQENC